MNNNDKVYNGYNLSPTDYGVDIFKICDDGKHAYIETLLSDENLGVDYWIKQGINWVDKKNGLCIS